MTPVHRSRYARTRTPDSVSWQGGHVTQGTGSKGGHVTRGNGSKGEGESWQDAVRAREAEPLGQLHPSGAARPSERRTTINHGSRDQVAQPAAPSGEGYTQGVPQIQGV